MANRINTKSSKLEIAEAIVTLVRSNATDALIERANNGPVIGVKPSMRWSREELVEAVRYAARMAITNNAHGASPELLATDLVAAHSKASLLAAYTLLLHVDHLRIAARISAAVDEAEDEAAATEATEEAEAAGLAKPDERTPEEIAEDEAFDAGLTRRIAAEDRARRAELDEDDLARGLAEVAEGYDDWFEGYSDEEREAELSRGRRRADQQARAQREQEERAGQAARQPSPRRGLGLDLDAAITVLAASNPKRPGSKSHARFALYRTGMSVREAMEAGVTKADLRHDQDKGFVLVGAKARPEQAGDLLPADPECGVCAGPAELNKDTLMPSEHEGTAICNDCATATAAA